MRKRHIVGLTGEQGAAPVRREDGPLTRRHRNRVQIVHRPDPGETDREIADGLGVRLGAVAIVRRRFTLGRLDASHKEKPRTAAVPVLDGKADSIVIATACSPVPEGRARWTARVLASRLVELEVVEGVSEDRILRVLNKASSSRGGSSRGAHPWA